MDDENTKSLPGIIVIFLTKRAIFIEGNNMQTSIRRFIVLVFIILCIPFTLPGRDIDTAISWRKETKFFFFSSGSYIKYDIRKQTSDIGYPRTIDNITWPGLWIDGIDAGINRGNGKIYFFKGTMYIRYDEKSDRADPGYPKVISGNWPGLWADGIDAAINWGNGKAYFFKGNEFIRYDIKSMKPDPGYPKLIQNAWPGLWTGGIDAAVNKGDGKAYFFKGNSYIRYDIKAGRADAGYPRIIRSSNWPGLQFDFWLTLSSMNKSSMKPGIKPDYAFPVSKQYHRGCFAFALNHILEYRYKTKIDLLEAEKKIRKPREDLWTHTHIQNFLAAYNITMTWYNDVDTFFHFLSKGVPVMIQYKWYNSDINWVGHFVAAYSFDGNGVWVSDSISVQRIHLPYDEVLDAYGEYTQFSFALVEKNQ
ncbi:MAG: hypothetical protein JXB88_12030 [Spirochaetales bacterium]|nr:hypothetical protein [Spirochaetales bacterium]